MSRDTQVQAPLDTYSNNIKTARFSCEESAERWNWPGFLYQVMVEIPCSNLQVTFIFQ